jgi:hypothetical protein
MKGKVMPAGRKRNPADFVQSGNLMYNVNKFVERCREQEDGCIVWVGGKHRQGYGMCGGHYADTGTRFMTTAHRAAVEIKLKRELTRDEYVIHSGCTNNLCVNPEHLSVGDSFERSKLMVERGNSNLAKKMNPPARQPNRKYKWTDEEIRFARMNDTAAIARKMNITKGEAGRMRWECRKGYVWLD